MAVKVMTLGQTKSYVWPKDPDKGNPKETVFEIGTLDVFVAAQIADGSLFFRNGGSQFSSNAAAIERVRFGLKGVKGLVDEHGKIVKLEFDERQVDGEAYQVVKDDFLRKLPLELIRDLGQEIADFNVVKPDEAKNSVVA